MVKLCQSVCRKKQHYIQTSIKNASPSYKTRNEKKPEEIPIIEPTIKVLKKEEPIKFTRKNTTKKVVENITLKL